MSTQFAPIWNNASVDFSCIKANVTNTNSGSGSTLLDLLVDGTSKFKVDKSGTIKGGLATLRLNDVVGARLDYPNNYLEVNSSNIVQSASGFTLGLGTSYNGATLNKVSTYVQFDFNNGIGVLATSNAAYLSQAFQVKSYNNIELSPGGSLSGPGNHVAIINGTSAQALRIYNTTDAGLTNYERAKIAWESNVLQIGTEKLGTGAARALELQTDGTTRLTIDAGGGVTVQSGTTLQVGSGTSIDINGFTVVGVGKNGFRQSGGGYIIFNADGVLKISNNSDNGFGRLQFGGTTSSFPAIKRNSAALNFRLADDSADCDITAKAATFSGNVTVSAVNIVTDTTTGTKIGTATTQKLGFYNASPVVQPAAVADATDAASVITQLNLLLARMRDLGLIAT